MPIWKMQDDFKVLFTNKSKTTSEKFSSYQKKWEWDSSPQYNSTISKNNTATIMKINFENITITHSFLYTNKLAAMS